MTSIGEAAFRYCTSLYSINIPQTVTTIGNGAFFECQSLESIILPDDITTIGDENFYNCARMSDIHLPAALTTIGRDAFAYCGGLSSISIPEGVTILGENAFANCTMLTSINLPESLSAIGESAFYNCSYLSSVTVPNGITRIEDSTFEHCNALTQIEMKSKTPLNYRQGFNNTVYTNATLYVPAGSRSVYESTAPWSNFSNIVERVFTGINEIEAASNAKPEITVNYGTIYVNGLADNAPVTILDINGRVVYSGTEHRLNNLVPGLYIVKAGNHTAKAVL